MSNTPNTNGFATTTVEVNGVEMTGTWVTTEDLVPGRTYVVEGPAIGMFWRDANTVTGVRDVQVVGDRTNTRVVLMTDDPTDEDSGSWGNFSRMVFLTVEPVAC